MKNLLIGLLFVSVFFMNACEKNEGLFADNDAVEFQDFEIDGVVFDDPNELISAPFTLAIGEGIRLKYGLVDNRKIQVHSLFIAVNDRFDQRIQIFLDEDVDSEWISTEQYFRLADLIRLDSGEVYSAEVGDDLYFFVVVKDKAGNESARKFIVEVV